MTIKAVLFDLGGTLVYSYPEETFQKILSAHGIIEPIDRVKQAMVKANKEFDIEKHIRLSAHEFYLEWNLLELRHLGIKDQAKARKLAGNVTAQWFQVAQIHVYPEVKPTLHKLKQMGLRLGMITGGFEEDIRQILPKAGLEGVFDVCVGADTVGKRKPNPEAFRYALSRLQVRANEAIFVGDNLEADYLGAEKTGMIPILIKRDDRPPSGIRSIKGLDEIFRLLKQINP